jgi:hypothetical protein
MFTSNWFSAWLRRRQNGNRRGFGQRIRPTLECLEVRVVPSSNSTTSTLAGAPAGIASVDPASSTWHIRSSATPGVPDVGVFSYGAPGSIPVLGDWNGDGIDTVGVFNPKTATWQLRNENSAGAPDAGTFQYGEPGWIPVVGDWTGTGHTGIGVVDPTTNTWYLRSSANAGGPDVGTFQYGAPGWIPVSGDWTGSGKTGIAVIDPTNNFWHVRSVPNAGGADIGTFPYGAPGWQPVTGDWTGTGHTGIGVIDPTGTWYLRAEDGLGAPDAGTFPFGLGSWKGVAGVVAPLPITLSPSTLPAATVGTNYSEQLTATGGSQFGFTFALTSGVLPGDLSLTSDGLLSGVPATTGSSTFTVTATDSSGGSGSQSYTLNVNGSAITLSPTTLPNGTVGTAYSEQLTATGGSQFGFTFALTSGVLPGDLSLSSAGLLSGIPASAGSSTFTVTATDSGGATGSQAYTLTVSATAITLSPTTLPTGTVGTAYSQQLTASGGTGTGFSFSKTAGALPAGLSLSSDGLLSGVPATAQSSTFTVTATDSGGAIGSQTYTLTANVAAITLSPTVLPTGTVGTAYSQQLTASGGTGTGFSFAVTTGTLPNGFSLSSAGLLSGVPVSEGSSSFTVTATDSGGATGSLTYTLSVNGLAITLSPTTLPDGTAGAPYSQQLTASGGTGTGFSFAVTTGTLPNGLTLSSAGLLSGVPASEGSSSFTVTATDSGGATGSLTYTLNVTATVPAITLSPTTLPNPTANTTYTQQLTASGGSGTGYSFAVTIGALPAGLSLAMSGKVSGRPTTAGDVSFTVTVTDSLGTTASQDYSVTVNPAITLGPATLPSPAVNSPYSQQLTASGGSSGTGFTFALIIGTLPSGLTLSSSGLISGMATTTGSSTFLVTATDNTGVSGAHQFSITVNPVLTLSPTTLPNPTVNTAYSQQLTAGGGSGMGYSFATTTGALPAGLSLSPSGKVSGRPTTVGSFSFTVKVKDSNGAALSQNYSMTVDPAITLSPATLRNTVLNSPYSQQLTASGGSGTGFTFALTSGTLPSGLTLSSSGLISGMATTTGSSSLTVTATDSTGASASHNYSITVTTAITLSPTTLPIPTVNNSYSQQLTASGGSGTGYSFAVTTGALPAGLSLATSGKVSGKPTTAGNFSFTVTVTDSLGITASQDYSLTVNPAITLGPATLTNTAVNSPYSQQLTASGGSGTGFTFTLTSGALPSGLTLSSSGLLSGTPTTPETISFTILVTDSTGASASHAYSNFIVHNAIKLTPTKLPAGTVGASYSQTLTASGGSGAGFTYAVTAGALPPGLNLDMTTGMISGMPTVTVTSPFTVTATDVQDGSTGSQDYTLTVNP